MALYKSMLWDAIVDGASSSQCLGLTITALLGAIQVKVSHQELISKVRYHRACFNRASVPVIRRTAGRPIRGYHTQARRYAHGLQRHLPQASALAEHGQQQQRGALQSPPLLVGLHGGPSIDHLAMMLATLACGYVSVPHHIPRANHSIGIPSALYYDSMSTSRSLLWANRPTDQPHARPRCSAGPHLCRWTRSGHQAGRLTS